MQMQGMCGVCALRALVCIVIYTIYHHTQPLFILLNGKGTQFHLDKMAWDGNITFFASHCTCVFQPLVVQIIKLASWYSAIHPLTLTP